MFQVNKKNKRLSFGIDWGDHSVKFVGLRLIGSEFELTHCLLFDLPEQNDSQQIKAYISKRLKQINLHGGKVTVNLPTNHIQFKRIKHCSRLEALKAKLTSSVSSSINKRDLETLQADISRECLTQQWLPRLQLANISPRLELNDFSLPILEHEETSKQAKIYLNIGYEDTRITFAHGQNILDNRSFNFSLKEIIPDFFDQEKSKKAYALLRSAQLHHKDNKWHWHTTMSMENINDLLVHIEKRLQSMAKKLLAILKYYYASFSLPVRQIKIVNSGGLYPWIAEYLSKQPTLEVENIKPFSNMIQTKNKSYPRKLQETEPLFAQSVAMALSGAQSSKLSRSNLRWKLCWFSGKKNNLKRNINRFALALTFFILSSYMIFSLHVNQKYHKYRALQLYHQDLKQEVKALQNRIQFESFLSHTKKTSFIVNHKPRLSQILKAIGEEIPNGIWITNIQLVNASQIKEFQSDRTRNKSENKAFIIKGKSIAANYISTFYRKLYDSGFFEQLAIKRDKNMKLGKDTIPYKIFAKIGIKYEEKASKN